MNAVMEVENRSLPEPVARRGINEAQWRTLAQNLFPGAAPQSVLMVWDYCVARKLDPMKKPCHIVPMRVKDQRSGDWQWRDVVMPGIYEYRTTAMRTGLYLGHSKPEYGPWAEVVGVTAPEWCEMTIYRWNKEAQQRFEFPVRVYFREVVATNKEGVANDRWRKAPVQMLTKCTEAAGLREGFPDELGGEPTAEEMDGRSFDDSASMSANPRDGLEPADPFAVDSYVAQITDTLAQDVEEEIHADGIFAIHQKLNEDAGLYVAVQDALKARKIIAKKGWDALVQLGSKRYQESRARPA
jgi:phage recombination protein Bet